MTSTAERQKAFETIDVNGNGTIEFKEWYKHFSALIRKGKSSLAMDKLLDLYKVYEGGDKGINFEEYSSFMDDVFGRA